MSDIQAVAPNDNEAGYGPVAKSFHWVIVAILAVQFSIAWTMPDIHRGTRPEGLVGLHLSFGFAILVIAVARLLWKIRHPVSLVIDGTPRWQYLIARATHGLLYLVLLILPVLGWANASARGWTPSIFGLFPLPQILPTGSPLGRLLGGVHTVTAYVLLALIGLHVAATLYHQFLLRDGTLSRMMPGNR